MQLNSLYLDGNLITAQGAAYIAKLIPTTPEISSVMLGQNELGDEGVLCLSPKLTAPTIKRLNLNENRITDIGACALGRDLANHPNMWDMQIANNHIGDQGVVELMSAVRTMPKIQKIKLGANDFGTIGAEAIARAFNLSSLNYVNLQDMIFDDRALRALKQAESTAKETMGLAKIHLGSSQPSAIPQAPAASLAVGINNRPPPYSHS